MSIIECMRYKVQKFNPYKYWKYRTIVTDNNKPKIVRIYCLYKIKKMDAFNNASLGTNLDVSSNLKEMPKFPHGLNGIIVSQFATIGTNCTIYHQVTIGSKDNKTAPVIGNNVTIYPGAKIIGNITIGDNVVIGANSVVTKSIESNLVVAGVPAKVINK